MDGGYQSEAMRQDGKGEFLPNPKTHPHPHTYTHTHAHPFLKGQPFPEVFPFLTFTKLSLQRHNNGVTVAEAFCPHTLFRIL